MMLKIYQTVSKTPPTGARYSVPIFSKRVLRDGKIVSEPWLGDGYYFWESFVENAEYWGRTHYNGNFDIYVGEYDPSDAKCLNLVDNLDSIKFMEQAYSKFIKTKKYAPKYLNQILYFLLKQESFTSNYDFIRVTADGGMKNGGDVLFAENFQLRYFLIRQIQVCFWKRRCELDGLVKYERPVEKEEWLA